MNSTDKNGSSLKDQLEAVWRMTGKKPPELDLIVELPEEFYEVWGWFLKLNARRGSNGFGVNCISYSEMLAFFQLIEYHPHSWEIEMIERFDNVALKHYSEQQKKEQEKAKKKK